MVVWVSNRSKGQLCKMRLNKCCCFDLRFGSLILLGVGVFLAVNFLRDGSFTQWSSFIIDVLFYVIGFVAVLKVNHISFCLIQSFIILYYNIIIPLMFPFVEKTENALANNNLANPFINNSNYCSNSRNNEIWTWHYSYFIGSNHSGRWVLANNFTQIKIKIIFLFPKKKIIIISVLFSGFCSFTALVLWSYKQLLEEEAISHQGPSYQAQFQP